MGDEKKKGKISLLGKVSPTNLCLRRLRPRAYYKGARKKKMWQAASEQAKKRASEKVKAESERAEKKSESARKRASERAERKK